MEKSMEVFMTLALSFFLLCFALTNKFVLQKRAARAGDWDKFRWSGNRFLLSVAISLSLVAYAIWMATT